MTDRKVRWLARRTTGVSGMSASFRASGIKVLHRSGPGQILRPDDLCHKGDSEAWLAAEDRLISMGEWTAPKARRLAEERVTFGQFADAWLDQRDLKPGTRELYRSLLDKQILSTFGPLSLADIRSEKGRVGKEGRS